MAWPIILANIATPLLGLVDTAVLGHLGSVQDLGAIALGALIFNFLYWSFGFLRMGTTGFVAQADGADDQLEVRAAIARAGGMALVLGLAIVLLQTPLRWLALYLFDASAAVESTAGAYFSARIWGAPAALGLIVITGSLIGLGKTRQLLWVQLVLNGLNIGLDLLFAGALGWGATGIAVGTAISEWTALGFGSWLLLRILAERHPPDEPFWDWPRVFDAAAIRKTLSANTDIMIRTFIILLCFGYFTNQGAQFGDVVLAANHILQQFVTFSAYFLDGYAQAAEAVVGRAMGRRDVTRFDRAVRRSSHFALVTAALLAATLLLGGGQIIAALTSLPEVIATAGQYLPWCALYVLLSVAAFQLDGVFIGATRTRAMRNAAAAAAAGFVVAVLLLAPRYGNAGLWTAMNVYVVLRAATLLVAYPGLRRAVARA